MLHLLFASYRKVPCQPRPPLHLFPHPGLELMDSSRHLMAVHSQAQLPHQRHPHQPHQPHKVHQVRHQQLQLQLLLPQQQAPVLGQQHLRLIQVQRQLPQHRQLQIRRRRRQQLRLHQRSCWRMLPFLPLQMRQMPALLCL